MESNVAYHNDIVLNNIYRSQASFGSAFPPSSAWRGTEVKFLQPAFLHAMCMGTLV